MNFPDNRGRAAAAKAIQNKLKIVAYFKENPEGLQRQCAESTGLHITTVEGHIRDMKKNGAPRVEPDGRQQ